MRNWYLLTHNSNYRQSLTVRIEELDVGVYSPQRITLYKRNDRPGPREIEKTMFPGYLFLYFDPEEVHTTKITALSGAHGFVRFGGEVCVLQDLVIQGLRKALLLPNRRFNDFEFSNLPSEMERALHHIVGMATVARRKAAFFALLEQNAMKERLERRAGARRAYG